MCTFAVISAIFLDLSDFIHAAQHLFCLHSNATAGDNDKMQSTQAPTAYQRDLSCGHTVELKSECNLDDKVCSNLY